MLSILKSDNTWFPESSDGKVFKLRANRDITISSKDFEIYDTGLNLDFSDKENVVFEVVDCHRNSLILKDNIMKTNNYLESKSKKVHFVNISNEDITFKETDFILTFCLKSKEIIQGVETEVNGDENKKEKPIVEEITEPTVEEIKDTELEVKSEEMHIQVSEPIHTEAKEEPKSEQFVKELVKPEVTAESTLSGHIENLETEEPIVSLDAPKKRKYVRKK